VASDFTLGPEKYIAFVQGFEERDELIDEPWIESCVHIDMDAKEILFWQFGDMSITSVRKRYLQLLEQQWLGWKFSYAAHEMYDIEKKMHIEYTAKQEYIYDYRITLEKLANDTVEEYVSCVIVYIKDGKTMLKNSYYHDSESFLFLGTEILPVIDQKPTFYLSAHAEKDVYDAIVIDCDQKRLFINKSDVGLEEKLADVWKDWTIHTGKYGYVGMLQNAGIDTSKIQMSAQEIEKSILEIIQREDSFDPYDFAKKFMEKDTDVQFNPSFFQNRKPSQMD
jgi:hypothetical protein